MTKFTLLKLGLLTFVAVSVFLGFGSILLKRKLTGFSRLIILLAGLGVLIGFDAFFIEPGWIETTKVKFHHNQLAETLKDIKVVQITDWHINKGIEPLHEKMIAKVNALNPDLIFITGDFFDDLTQVRFAQQVLSQIKAKVGIFGVPGNTDHISMDGRSLERALEPFGINILVNESVNIKLPNGKALQIVGVDDPKYHFGNIHSALSQINRNEPYIMLAHSPEIFKEAVALHVPAVLVGDTHGGQVGIEFLVRMSAYANRTPYIKGFYREGDTEMYVNRGIGMKTLPIRFLCRPEIAEIWFKGVKS